MRDVASSRLSQNTQVCAVDINEGVPRRLTTGARDVEGVTNGVADYCAMEEMDRYEGYWLSPDGSSVAFEEVDESHITPYRIVHQGDDDVHTFLAVCIRPWRVYFGITCDMTGLGPAVVKNIAQLVQGLRFGPFHVQV